MIASTPGSSLQAFKVGLAVLDTSRGNTGGNAVTSFGGSGYPAQIPPSPTLDPVSVYCVGIKNAMSHATCPNVPHWHGGEYPRRASLIIGSPAKF